MCTTDICGKLQLETKAHKVSWTLCSVNVQQKKKPKIMEKPSFKEYPFTININDFKSYVKWVKRKFHISIPHNLHQQTEKWKHVNICKHKQNEN